MSVVVISGSSLVTDTWLEEYGADTNHASDAVFDNIGCHGGSNTIWNNAILKFDVSSIPVGSTVNSAIIKLTKLGGYWDASVSGVYVKGYRLRRADMVITQATWNSYKTSNLWSTAGAQNTTNDRYSTKIWTDVLENAWFGVEDYVITLNSTGETMVQAWVDNSANNAGCLFEVQCAGATILASYLDFASTNHATASYRPYLQIDYTVPSRFQSAAPATSGASTSARIDNDALSNSRIGFMVNGTIKGYIDSTGMHDGSY